MTSAADFDRIGRFIYSFHRWASPGELRALQGEVAPALAESGAALVRRFDEVLADWQEGQRLARADSVSTERLDALLADARTFAAQLAYARNQ
ncbi:hypothetical protein [Massilia consociata]|uniref:Uncharacterized protein n=1 Tax=Massilia consociata TaxID=760117 RepID=A0ABV6FL86_9BURK